MASRCLFFPREIKALTSVVLKVIKNWLSA